MSRRTERIAAQLLDLLARLLHEEVTDPRVGIVTLTRADVAPDLTNALIYWSAFDVDADPKRVALRQAGLDSAAQFLRRRAAGELSLKRMPELRFRYDPSLVLGSRTLSVLREVAPDPASGSYARSEASRMARSEAEPSEDRNLGEQDGAEG